MAETQNNLPPTPYNNEMDLRELIQVLWAGKWLIGGITFAVTLISVVVALILPNIYQAEVLLAPNTRDGAGGLPALVAQYGGLAGLAGINIDSGSAGKTTLGLETLKSRKFISEFVQRHDILVPLIAAEAWNAETGDLEIDPDSYDLESGKWVRRVRPPKKTIPSSQEAYEKFMDILSVDQDNKTGFVTIGLEHYSPAVAKQWVDWLIEDLNTVILRQDVTDAEQAIDYLNKQINSTPLAGLRDVFFRLIEEQTKTVMLAEVSDEYVFKTIDPAILPERKTRPKRRLIVILCTIIGGLLGIMYVGLASWSNNKSAVQNDA